jgi:hypothetical protein
MLSVNVSREIGLVISFVYAQTSIDSRDLWFMFKQGGGHTSGVSLPPGDIIFAHLPYKWNNSLYLYKVAPVFAKVCNWSSKVGGDDDLASLVR